MKNNIRRALRKSGIYEYEELIIFESPSTSFRYNFAILSNSESSNDLISCV